MRVHPTRDRRRLIAAALLTVTLVVAVLTVAACGDGSEATSVTRTLTPEATKNPGKRGSSASPSVSPSASPSRTATTTPSATPTKSPTRITDKTIKANILARISQEPGLQGFEIRVAVGDGNVYLRGRVRTEKQRSLIEKIALSEPGVKKVVSAIDVDDAAGY
jgi:hypothetical protein